MDEHELRAKWIQSLMDFRRDTERTLQATQKAHLRTQCRVDAMLEELSPQQRASVREREEELYQIRLLEIEDDVSAGLAAALDDEEPTAPETPEASGDQPGKNRPD